MRKTTPYLAGSLLFIVGLGIGTFAPGLLKGGLGQTADIYVGDIISEQILNDHPSEFGQPVVFDQTYGFTEIRTAADGTQAYVHVSEPGLPYPQPASYRPGSGGTGTGNTPGSQGTVVVGDGSNSGGSFGSGGSGGSGGGGGSFGSPGSGGSGGGGGSFGSGGGGGGGGGDSNNSTF